MRLKILVICAMFLGMPGLAGASSPEARIEAFHAKLLNVMKTADSLGVKGRFDTLQGEVKALFDLKLMMALASGRYWRKAPESEQRKLVEAFGNFSAANYASRFDGFSGQKFTTRSVTEGPRGTRIVNTQIESPDRDPVAISYVMRKTGADWRIADILLVGGISEIATRRSEYRTILKSGGTGALTAMLEGKTRAMLGPEQKSALPAP